jgi:hypothetical protein
MCRLTVGPCPRCFRNGGPLPVSPRYFSAPMDDDDDDDDVDCTYPIWVGSSTSSTYPSQPPTVRATCSTALVRVPAS